VNPERNYGLIHRQRRQRRPLPSLPYSQSG
jgi:hypothetical protein